jgi:outer membrane lipoprotein carrier protein
MSIRPRHGLSRPLGTPRAPRGLRTLALLRGLAATLAALSALAIASTPGAVAQQARPDAATVAAWVQTFYDQTRTMSARFEQRYVSQVYQRTEVSRGRVQLRKPGMMRFDYDQPNGKVIASDGRRLIAYEPPESGETVGQYYEQQMTDAELPSALSFLMGTGRLGQDFTFRLLDAAQLGYPDGQVLELRSRRPTPHYARILLFVDDDQARRGVVHRVVIVDQANNRNQFNFTQQQYNADIPEGVFRYQPPSGARRVQPS